VPIGDAPSYRIPATSPAVAARRLVDGLRCRRRPADPVYGIHLELFANRLVVPVPAGIGVAPPLTRNGAYVTSGACTYPLSTLEPTGVVRVDARRPSLTTLFKIWGQPLSATRLASFRGQVQAFVGGQPWRRTPGAIPLVRHAEIVLEIGGHIPPHPFYRFPPGL
jgi:hypothetical protein